MTKAAHFFSRPPVRDRLLLVLLSLVLFLPFLGSVHLFDWDEINFAECSREMLVTGDYLRVQVDFQPFWEKPPLFFWLQVLSMKAFGVNEFAARFVNALCGMVTLLLVYGLGARLYSRRLGMFWALAFAGSLLPHMLFKSGIIDPVFNVLIFSGVYFLSRSTCDGATKGPGNCALAGLSIGLAVLAKGPVGFLVPALCLGAYVTIRRFAVRPAVAQLAVFAGCAAAVSFVFYGIETIAHGTWYLREFIKYHLRLLSTSEAGHGEPFYYHFVVLLFGCFPASILAMRPLFTRTPGSDSRADFKRWMVVLFWTVLVLFSIVKTKTVLYSSLAYFPLTFLAAYHIDALLEKRLVWRNAEAVPTLVFGVLIGLVFAMVPVVFMNGERVAALINDRFAAGNLTKDVSWSGYEVLAGIAYAGAVVVSLGIVRRGRLARGFATLFLASAFGIGILMIALVGRVENHMQRGPIEFYQGLAGTDCYVVAHFKSFADLF
ncbi:MAG: phospholipid carrier-dependent glycosyltransferase, partial [Chitinivibrionales bacterium]|nr:phospholipid carrier-dependent glycosyltransferase [Chitinivibrionales bacterium]MBD3394251.1 phospholipid carrier-dependent glycosyltransferase [Chitinivibrionales bacterium]